MKADVWHDINMKLIGLLKKLELAQQKHEQCKVVVMVRDQKAKPEVKFKYNQFPIVDVLIDHGDSEIDIVFETDDSSTGLSLQDLSKRLHALPKKCRKYNIFSGNLVPAAIDGYSIRVDVQIIGTVTHETNRVLGLLQIFEGFEKEFGLTE